MHIWQPSEYYKFDSLAADLPTLETDCDGEVAGQRCDRRPHVRSSDRKMLSRVGTMRAEMETYRPWACEAAINELAACVAAGGSPSELTAQWARSGRWETESQGLTGEADADRP